MALGKRVLLTERRDRFVLDYRDLSGVRKRPSFKLKREAEDARKLIELQLSGVGLLSQKVEEAKALGVITLKDAIKKYIQIKDPQ